MTTSPTYRKRVRAAALAGVAALLTIAPAALPAHAGDALVKDATVLSMAPPDAANLPFGQKALVEGTASGLLDQLSSQQGRTVSLELRTPNGWMPLRSADTTDNDGDYAVRVPSSWYYRGTIRTSVRASETHEAATSTDTTTVTVKPPYAPEGRASSWVHMFEDSGVRWDPCKVITVKVNGNGGPPKAVQQVRQALAKVAAATGLRFRYDGTTSAIPWRTDGRKPEYADAALTISWATPKQVEPLTGWTIGWGGGWYRDGEIFRGGISLDRTGTAGLKNGFGTGATWGAVLLHELGHVMGLGHVEERAQLMYPAILPTARGRFEAGDLGGLADQGAMRGCVPSPKRGSGTPHSFATY